MDRWSFCSKHQLFLKIPASLVPRWRQQFPRNVGHIYQTVPRTAVSRRSLTREVRVWYKVSRCGLVVDRVTVGYYFILGFAFSIAIVITRLLHTVILFICHRRFVALPVTSVSKWMTSFTSLTSLAATVSVCSPPWEPQISHTISYRSNGLSEPGLFCCSINYAVPCRCASRRHL
jgi:hypothetical protein